MSSSATCAHGSTQTIRCDRRPSRRATANEPVGKQHAVIVIADDDPMINTLLTLLLQDEGYQVLSCTTGAEALVVASRVKPDLVITDLRMEVEDAGYQLLQQLRADPRTAGIAVIICSAEYDLMSRAAGARTYPRTGVIQKPFMLDHLLDTIRQLLQSAAP